MLGDATFPVNQSSSYPEYFILVGLPGMEEYHTWLAIPFCLMYLLALLGNASLLFIISTERSLHQPMYFFLAMLAVADLALSSSTVPKTLGVLLASSREISFAACLTQMFFTHVSFIAESTILLAMAFDRYVAICDPLRYTVVLTHAAIAKIGLAALARSFCVMLPTLFLLRRLPYCGQRVMPHTYCEHMGIARMACADIAVNIWYGFTTTLLSPVLDLVLIAASYSLILRAIFRLPTKEARLKAVGTCGAHLCVILLFYTPALFSFFAHRFGRGIPQPVLVLLANVYQLLPPMLNPIVYAAKTKAIRERLVHAFRPAGNGRRVLISN
ncbi:PREDICTED: olfactory receptor 52B2-like [Gekko japonicus]|uniref:Olfactory receptor n=1 Tax=Gekko japonicus TaxID=146911 RepID=A0ABM1K9W8_GEKJA|nr:PREDICTED: olfactory receptor 52B2-like [Gekko japonicus]